MAKIAIDLFYRDTTPIRGMGRYAANMANAAAPDLLCISPIACFGFVGRLFVVRGGMLFPIWEQLMVPILVWWKEITHIVCPYNTAPLLLPASVRLTLVVHDTIFLHGTATGRSGFGAAYRAFITRRVARKACCIVTVSEASRSDIVHEIGVPGDRILVVPNTVSEIFETESAAPIAAKEPYVLSVTGMAPSKNLGRLLAGYSTYVEKGGRMELHVVGILAGDVKVERWLKPAARPFVKILGKVSDKQLLDEYRRASGYICASIEEGFGIPLIEAMACKTPVACSDCSALPEIAGDAAILFNPYSEDAIAGAFDGLSEAGRMKERIERGERRFRRYCRNEFALRCGLLWRKIRKFP